MDGTRLYHAWLELLQGYHASRLSMRDFLKKSVQVGCGYSLLGAVSERWNDSFGRGLGQYAALTH